MCFLTRSALRCSYIQTPFSHQIISAFYGFNGILMFGMTFSLRKTLFLLSPPEITVVSKEKKIEKIYSEWTG